MSENYSIENLGELAMEQQVMLRTMEFARILRVKDEYLANMSHELRTPLTSIISLAESLRMEFFGPLTRAQRDSLAIIEESGQHLIALINDILDLAKIDAGKMSLNLAKIHLVTCCTRVKRIVDQQARAKGMHLTVNVDRHIGDIYADSLRVTQLLVNLVNNAVRFTPEGGKIGLEVRGDRVRKEIYFTVWDTGIGIAPENMPRLFQPFVQLDRRLTQQNTGTGLGLSLVRRIAELHGGSITVESQVDRGSRFTFTLPWLEQPIYPWEQFAIAEHAPAADAKLVLLVEDNEMQLNWMARFIEACGYRVETASSGAAGVERALALRPDLILMDTQMPGLDGLQATLCLRRQPTMAATPIIALSALLIPDDRERCLEAGMTDYLPKPVDPVLLCDMIEKNIG